MTTITRRQLGAFHEAYLDHQLGAGMLVLPDPATDVFLVSGDRGEFVHDAGLRDAARVLDSEGWEFLINEEDGRPFVEFTTPSGRPVLALYGCDPITSSPTLDELAGTHRDLSAHVLNDHH